MQGQARYNHMICLVLCLYRVNGNSKHIRNREMTDVGRAEGGGRGWNRDVTKHRMR